MVHTVQYRRTDILIFFRKVNDETKRKRAVLYMCYNLVGCLSKSLFAQNMCWFAVQHLISFKNSFPIPAELKSNI